MDGKRRRTVLRGRLPLGRIACLVLGPIAWSEPARAADASEIVAEIDLPAAPRFFPRGDGEIGSVRLYRPAPRRVAGCAPWRVPVPTNAPNDPSYVGSGYGLGKPSYYGFTPPLGVDDPFGRPLRYCP